MIMCGVAPELETAIPGLLIFFFFLVSFRRNEAGGDPLKRKQGGDVDYASTTACSIESLPEHMCADIAAEDKDCGQIDLEYL